MGRQPIRDEFDMFDPVPFLEIPPLLTGRRAPMRRPGEQGTEAAAPEATPGVAASCAQVAAGGSAIRDVLACRREQIEKWGHTPEADAALPIAGFLNHMLHELQARLIAVLDDHRGRQGLAQIRKRLVKLAALILATIDRLDAEGVDNPPTTPSLSRGRIDAESAE